MRPLTSGRLSSEQAFLVVIAPFDGAEAGLDFDHLIFHVLEPLLAALRQFKPALETAQSLLEIDLFALEPGDDVLKFLVGLSEVERLVGSSGLLCHRMHSFRASRQSRSRRGDLCASVSLSPIPRPLSTHRSRGLTVRARWHSRAGAAVAGRASQAGAC